MVSRSLNEDTGVAMSGLTYQQKKAAVTARRLVKRGAAMLYGRFAVLIGAAVSAAAFMEQLEEFIQRDVNTLAYYVLRRAGLQIIPGDPLTKEGITEVIARQTGIEFTDIFSAEAVKRDLEKEGARRLEEATGLMVESLDRENLISAAQQIGLQIVANQAPSALAIAGFGQTARNVARDAYRENGIEKLTRTWSEHAKRWTHREAQRRWGAQNPTVWEWGDLGFEVRGRFRRRIKEKYVIRAWKRNNKQWRRIIKGKPITKPIIVYSFPAKQIGGKIRREPPLNMITLAELNRERARRKRWR